MARELERWLPELPARAGGEARLREAIAARRLEGTPAWQPALAAVICVLLAALVLPAPAERPQAPDIARALVLPPPAAVRVANGAALEVPVVTKGVRVVLVMDRGEGQGPR